MVFDTLSQFSKLSDKKISETITVFVTWSASAISPKILILGRIPVKGHMNLSSGVLVKWNWFEVLVPIFIKKGSSELYK